MVGTQKALRTSVVPEDANFHHLDSALCQDSRAVVGQRSEPAASKSTRRPQRVKLSATQETPEI